ncbi:TetR/AcrR family transcriptional regulator [Glycomyces arizonensis]|uniref:TetR/AcrR family transcriptional regulator n=1 Tax=Glycomyces arizonensis TaxID=256035 RepID=UPI00068540C0|nr:TetR/AcrR family transcriptional regulator [Glycomyces arizonensis]
MEPVLGETDDQIPAKGRPRSEAVSRSILEATLDLLAEHGTIADVSVEAVAERSGVSKATIYRRWPSKEALVAAAVESVKAPLPRNLPHTSMRDDLIFVGNNMRKSSGPRDRKIFKCMMLVAKDPDYKRYHDHFMERRQAFVKEVFDYWAERGELRDDIDPALAGAMFSSPLLTILVYGNYPELQAPDVVERVVDALLTGLRPQ